MCQCGVPRYVFVGRQTHSAVGHGTLEYSSPSMQNESCKLTGGQKWMSVASLRIGGGINCPWPSYCRVPNISPSRQDYCFVEAMACMYGNAD